MNGSSSHLDGPLLRLVSSRCSVLNQLRISIRLSSRVSKSMNGRSPLIIDDVESSFSHLSEFGKEVVGPIARSIRERVLLFAAVHSWPTVKHDKFVAWAQTQMKKDECWLVLDPLFPLRSDGRTMQPVRFTRVASSDGWRLDSEFDSTLREFVAGRSVSVLDDVAASGLTLRHSAGLVERSQGRVSRILVCASADAGRTAILQSTPTSDWTQFVPGDFTTVHLRDACPGLPFAGRRIRERDFVDTDFGRVGVSAPVTAFRGGPWSQLTLDSNLTHTIASARRLLTQRLSEALGRRAIVADIRLLGPSVNVPLKPGQVAAAETPLESLH